MRCFGVIELNMKPRPCWR